MTDTPLLDWTPPYQRHSPTSKAAAEQIKPVVWRLAKANASAPQVPQ